METVAIVGMSLAGVRAAETLRHEGFSGRIVEVSSEPHLPYDLPPCSKQLPTGVFTLRTLDDALAIRELLGADETLLAAHRGSSRPATSGSAGHGGDAIPSAARDGATLDEAVAAGAG